MDNDEEDDLYCPLETLQITNLPRLECSYNTAAYRLPTCKLVIAPKETSPLNRKKDKPAKMASKPASKQTVSQQQDNTRSIDYNSLDHCITDYVKVQKLHPRRGKK